MSNDFPFNHFINLEKSNKNNNLNNNEIKPFEFEELTQEITTSIPEQNQTLSDNAFSSSELQSISEEIMMGLKQNISPQKYNAFFSNSFAVSNITTDLVEFSVTTSFIKKMIETHYITQIQQILLTILGTQFRVRINVLNQKPSTPVVETQVKSNTSDDFLSNSFKSDFDMPTEKPAKKSETSISDNEFNLENFFKTHNIDAEAKDERPNAAVNTTSGSPSFRLDANTSSEQDIKAEVESKVIKATAPNPFVRRLDRSKTFDSFVVGPSNNMGYAFSLAVAKDPGTVYPQLYIHGNSGLGKTHLLHALCNYIAENKPHLRICFTNANEFMSEMVLAIQSTTGKDNKISEFRRKYTELVDVLIIDDIHELKNKTRTQAEFFFIFNELQSKGKQLVFTSDKTPKEIVGIEDRIRTRLSSALLIDIQQPDLETRIAILRKKALEKDIFLDDDVINLIASCVKTNVRELEGNLVKLGAYSDLMNVDIDLEIAKEQLNLCEGLDDKVITIESITKSVASYFKIALGDIKGKSRKKEVAMARHMAMYMCHKILKKTLEEIGEFFDNRDHSTVIHGIKKIQNLIKEDSKISQQLYEIESRL